MKRGFSGLLSLVAVLFVLGPAVAGQGPGTRPDGIVVAAADCPCGPECKCDHKDGCQCKMGEGKECKCGSECKCDHKDGCRCGDGGHKG